MLNLPCTRLTSDFEIIQVDLTDGKTDEVMLSLWIEDFQTFKIDYVNGYFNEKDRFSDNSISCS